jgi:ArsR family transcriptional regulator, virulence genes transcriptional regulator
MTALLIDKSISELEVSATEAAGVLKSLSNEKRLMILCKLLEEGEMSVLPIAEAVGLGQSALSQHLARMRAERIVDFRRDGQTLYYRIADPKVAQLLKSLKAIFC